MSKDGVKVARRFGYSKESATSILIAAAMMAGATPLEIVRLWRTETRHGIVEINPCAGAICGRLVSSDGIRANPNSRDEKNKDVAQRGRTLKGLVPISGSGWDGSAWSGGQIYNPDDGGTYKATVTTVDATHLKVRGCIVWPLCKTQTWTRLC